jgi:hypothetical protein
MYVDGLVSGGRKCPHSPAAPREDRDGPCYWNAATNQAGGSRFVHVAKNALSPM